MLIVRPNDRQGGKSSPRGAHSTARRLRLFALCALVSAPWVNAARAADTLPATFSVSVIINDFCRVEADDVRFDATNSETIERDVGVRNPIALTCNEGVTVSSVAIRNDALDVTLAPRRTSAGARSDATAQIGSRATLEACSPLRAMHDAGRDMRTGTAPLLGRNGGGKTIHICTLVMMPRGNAVLLANAGMARVSFTYN